MQEILQHVYESHQDQEEDQVLDSDDEDFVNIKERLAGVNLDDTEQVWAQLTSDERQAFEAFLR